MRYKIYFIVLLVSSAFLFFAPISAYEYTGLGIDKLVHIYLFFALYYSARASFQSSGRIDPILVLLIFYALLVEVVQGKYLPYRSFDQFDFIADVFGVSFGFIYYRFYEKKIS